MTISALSEGVSVAAYIRVSSKGQDFKTQRHAIDQAARARGVAIAEWFSEKRTATKAAARPELDRLLAAAIAGRLRAVFVFRLDRFTRLGVADTLTTLDTLRKSGVMVHFVADGLPSIDPADTNSIAAAIREAVLAVMAACARIEGLARSERVAAARERMEEEGLPWGRPTKERTEKATPRVHALKAEGLTVRDIAQRVGLPRSTVGRILSQKAADKSHGETPPQDAVNAIASG